jgi:two-component system, sensor histidine kinase PdtaS
MKFWCEMSGFCDEMHFTFKLQLNCISYFCKSLMKAFFYTGFLICVTTFNLLAQQSLTERAMSYLKIDSALQKENKQLSNYQSLYDTLHVIETYLAISDRCNGFSYYKKSEEACSKALQLAVAKKNMALVAKCYNGLANMYSYKQDNSNALSYYFKAKDLCEKSGNASLQLTLFINLGEFYRKMAQFDEAQKYINKAFAFYKTKNLKDTLQLIRLYNRQAAIKYEVIDKDSSLYFSFKAIELCQLTHNKLAEAVSLNEIGAVYRDRQDLQKAIAYFNEAKDIFLKEKSYRSALETMTNIVMLRKQNNYPKEIMIKECNDIINLTNERCNDFPLFDVYYCLHDLYLKEKDSAKAYIYLLGVKKSHEVYMYKKLNAEIITMQEKYENDKVQTEVNTVTKELNVKKKQTYFIAGITTVLAVLMLLIGYLLYNNIKKNKLLQTQNNYKDVLIQEIHHRVKNNLEFINSLIDMQKNSSENETEIGTLLDTARRINSMSIMHEMLYNHDKMEGVQLQNYINELVSSIDEMSNTQAIPIQFTVNVPMVMVTPTQAIALGMITSEFISNSIKYAFTKDKNPNIKIDLRLLNNSNEYQYTLADNGIGYTFETTNKSKLGMRLIDIFSRQLKGTYTFENNQGLNYHLTFKI